MLIKGGNEKGRRGGWVCCFSLKIGGGGERAGRFTLVYKIPGRGFFRLGVWRKDLSWDGHFLVLAV